MIDPVMIRRAFGSYKDGDSAALTREDLMGCPLWRTPKPTISTNGKPKEREALKGSK